MTGEARTESAGVEHPNYAQVNRRGWDTLATILQPTLGCDQMATAREQLDPYGWLPWERLRTILCLAGGGGLQGPLFASLGYRVTVADLSAVQLSHDRRIAESSGLQVECVQADMLDLRELHGRNFDLVYQPISTCYVPDVSLLYAEVARVLGSAGLYLAEHWLSGQIQLGEPRWDGSAYRVAKPVESGEPIPWRSPQLHNGEVATCWHFSHPLGRLLGDLCGAGFAIVQVCEPVTGSVASPVDSEEHLAAHLRPFLRVLARSEPS